VIVDFLARHLPLGIRRFVVRATPRAIYAPLRRRFAQRGFIGHGYDALTRAWIRRRLSAVVTAEPTVELVRVHGGMRLCTTVETATAAGVKQANLNLVADLLDRHGVPYFLVRTGVSHRHRIGVLEQHRADLLRLLREEYANQAVYVASQPDRRLRRMGLARRLHRNRGLSTTTRLRVFRISVDPGATLVLGAVYGCEVEFWTDDASQGAWLGPHRNQVSSWLPEEYRQPATIEIRERLYPTVKAFTEKLIGDVDFPMDVVYTWVDGDDPLWRAKKERWLGGVGDIHPHAANTSRFFARDDLRYSLRSVDMYGDFVRTIYLVTDGQVPAWLDTSHPKLQMVDHREIFDPKQLPTFNSHAIESRLHHIDGLSEQYLYLNDDVFFGRMVTPDVFFHANGLSKFFTSRVHVDLGAATAADVPVLAAGKNNRSLLEKEFGRFLTSKLKHVPHSQLRSVLFEMEERFPEQFARTSASRFRHPDDISIAASLHHYYAYLTGRAVPGEIRYTYTDLADPDTPRRLARLLANRPFDVFCLNDTDMESVGSDGPDHSHDFLDRYFPLKSSFEL
jgi:hypothetical protein